VKTSEALDDDYLSLIRQFPLRAIRSEKEHGAAGRVLNRLLGRQSPPLSHGEGEYLDALIELTKAYESVAHRISFEKMTPLEAVRYLMAQNGLNTETLGKIMGSQTAASLFLTGRRPLSKAQIFKLGEHFKVDPAVFLGTE
jgi:antitoxin component HigA of HigAB toxin-antitoxin module